MRGKARDPRQTNWQAVGNGTGLHGQGGVNSAEPRNDVTCTNGLGPIRSTTRKTFKPSARSCAARWIRCPPPRRRVASCGPCCPSAHGAVAENCPGQDGVCQIFCAWSPSVIAALLVVNQGVGDDWRSDQMAGRKRRAHAWRLSDKQRAEVERLIAAGETQETVAEAVKCDVRTVIRWVVRPLAARHEREPERTAPPILPERHRPLPPRPSNTRCRRR